MWEFVVDDWGIPGLSEPGWGSAVYEPSSVDAAEVEFSHRFAGSPQRRQVVRRGAPMSYLELRERLLVEHAALRA